MSNSQIEHIEWKYDTQLWRYHNTNSSYREKFGYTIKYGEKHTPDFPAHIAARFGRLELLQKLEKEGYFNQIDESGENVLYAAVQSESKETLNYLLKTSPTLALHCHPKTGDGIIHFALLENKMMALKMICEHVSQINVNGKNKDGVTPLHVACYLGNLEAVKYLVVERHADLTIIDNVMGQLPLHYACAEGHLDIVKFILSDELSMKDEMLEFSSYDTPLHTACRMGQMKIVEYLLSIGANAKAVNKRMKNGILHLAIQSKDMGLFHFLIASGICDINLKNEYHFTPLDVSREEMMNNMEEILLAAGGVSGLPNYEEEEEEGKKEEDKEKVDGKPLASDKFENIDKAENVVEE